MVNSRRILIVDDDADMRDALVEHRSDGMIERWSYRDLWDRSVEIARALIAAGGTQAAPRTGVSGNASSWRLRHSWVT